MLSQRFFYQAKKNVVQASSVFSKMSTENKQSKAVVMKPPSGPLAIRKRVKIKKPPKTALEEEEFTKVCESTRSYVILLPIFVVIYRQ